MLDAFFSRKRLVTYLHLQILSMGKIHSCFCYTAKEYLFYKHTFRYDQLSYQYKLLGLVIMNIPLALASMMEYLFGIATQILVMMKILKSWN